MAAPRRPLRILLAALLLAGVSAGLAACDLFGSDDSFGGELRVLLTDAPFPTDRIQGAVVTIDRLDLLNGQREALRLFDERKTFDLMQLRSGNAASLTNVSVPPDEYALLRLHVAETATLVDQSGAEHEIALAGDAESVVEVGLGRLTIENGATGSVTLDFNLDNSFTLPEGADPDSVALDEFSFAPSINLQDIQDGVNRPDRPQAAP